MIFGRCAERRQGATERERHRLQRLNAAFDELRERTCRHVTSHTVTHRPVRGRRVSKLDILRRTMSYIEHLERLLDDSDQVTRYRSVHRKTNVVSRYSSGGHWNILDSHWREYGTYENTRRIPDESSTSGILIHLVFLTFRILINENGGCSSVRHYILQVRIIFTPPPTRRYASAVFAAIVCLSVCLSIRQKSEFYENGSCKDYANNSAQ